MSTHKKPSQDERWADLADLILIISREIQFRGYHDERAIPLSQSEGMVMRYLIKHEQAAPSGIAAATGLQRTNLSTVLRSLEEKGLAERRACPTDGRGVTVRPTRRGRDNYALVRQEWAAELSQATKGRSDSLEYAIELLRAVEGQLVRTRPRSVAAHPNV